MPRPPGPRPSTWKSGPDPVRHQQYTAWQRAGCQARFRGETWNMSFEDYVTAWGQDWSRRGRGREDLCLVRCDPFSDWRLDNVRLITRHELGSYQQWIRQQRQQHAEV